MALQQTENVSDVNINEDNSKNNAANIQNGTDVARHTGSIHHQSQQAQQQQIHNTRPMQQQHPQQNSSNLNEKFSTTKSPPIQSTGMMSLGGSPNNGGDPISHNYNADQVAAGAHYGQTQPPNQQQQQQHIVSDNLNQKDDPYGQQSVTMGNHPPYGRYHPNDPNNSTESYRYGHSSMQPGKPPGIMTPNRPPQRYVPGQQIQGPTPTLNSLLQSHPPPPQQQRYPNNYDSQQQTGPQQPQTYSSQGWSLPPRPYSPQMGQTYRTPSPANTPRNQPGYPMPPGQVTSYTSSPQQTISTHTTGPTPTTSQYTPYPQRYSTPPGSVAGTNHRGQYSQQYPDVNRSWTGPGSSSPAVSPGPGVHPNAPASPHQMQHAVPPPNSPGHVPCGSPQPPQASPSPHQEMVGQNSNDSSSGGGICTTGSVPPGTPQQAMRPTPSPTGSSGSRSMSPAVAQQNISMPVRILNTQLTPTSVGMLSNMSMQQQHSNNMQAQNQQQLTSEPVLGQLAARTSNINSSQVSQQSQITSSQQQSVQVSGNITTQSTYQSQLSPQSNIHNYKMGSGQGQPNPQNISPYTTPPPPPPSSQQYQQGNYAPRPQYPSGYGTNPNTGQLPPTNTMPPVSNQYVGRSLPNQGPGSHPQFPPYQQGWSTASPPTASGLMPNHGQGKNTPLPSQTPMGSPRPLNYLKQHLQHKSGFVGAPSPTPPQNYGNGSSMHPPMGPPHHMGPPHGPSSMGPPSSAPQNTPSPQPPSSNNPPSGCTNTLDTNTMVDHNNVSQDNSGSSSSTMSSHPVTSVVTTGPDGAPLVDEASQQSTLSNASAASGEDPQCLTPKSRKNDPYNHGHLAPPNASPGQGHGNEDFEMHSPSNWPRAAASPVFNHVPQENYRASTKKSDSLCKLYDMDENPDRRGWLDKLLTFMEERRTPISACPTISKQPLDLYRLYIYVKERGGFVEVTKSKTWKDIAGLLGIGASSSAAYTLRKHYTKNLLAFECHFDRGGVDPLPIIQQVEAGSKKKTTKAASVPSPAGSSNSQDSFPSSVSANVSMDGYPGYTTGNYATNAQADFSAAPQIQRPPSQNNAQSSHPGVPYQGQPNFNQYGTEQYNPAGPPGQYSQTQNQFPPPNRTMFTPYGSENDAGGNSANNFAPYGPTRPYNQPPVGNSQPSSVVATSTSSPSTPSTYPPQPPSQQDYYRQQEQNSQPRRHPDFVKESQSYPGYAQRPQIYPGWQNNPAAQYRNQYPSQQAQQQWNSPRPSLPAQPQPNQQQPQPGNQWEQHRYPPQAQQSYQPNTPPPSQWNTLGNTGQSPNSNSPLRPTHRGPSGNGKQPPFNMPPPPQVGPGGGNKSFVQQSAQQAPGGSFISGGQIQKRDIIFPPDSIEATTPILYRRKRLAKNDVCPIDPWRIFMSLRSGLLSESTWALDILNVLLFDDSAVQYFGLSHLPGLLNLLLEHFQKSLLEMFVNNNKNKENPIEFNCQGILENNDEDIDLGQIVSIPNSDERVLILSTTQNFTLVTRKGIPVRIQNAEEDIFVSETLKKWDYESNKNYQLGTPNCSDPWTYGHNDRFPHNGIIDVFKSEIVDIPFARYLKPKINKLERKNNAEQQQSDNNNSETSTKTDDLRSVINKRPYIVPTNTEEIKRKKSNDDNWNENSLAIKTEINGDDGSSTSDVKQQLIDSDCRQVDMEIEPRNMPNSNNSSGNRTKTSATDNQHESQQQTVEENRSKNSFDPKITVKDPATILRRRRMSEYEDECYTRDEASLYLVNDSQDILARRCICLSNIFRNLTFVPGNEVILARSSTFLALLGNLLLLNHDHVLRTHKNRNYDREEDTDFGDSCSSLQGEKEWWWEYLIQIRENMLVAVANIAGHLELSKYEEIITRPVLDGLLHWAVCPSAHGQDPFPSCGPITVLSPQRLALEALCKLCVTDANVDLVIATPPFSRLEKLCSVLTRHLCRNEDQVLREFSVNLLHYLAAADSAMSRTVALQSPCISYLVAFIEQAEQTALGVANQHGINYLRENPDSMGTSLDMLRRAAGTLLHLSKHPDNRPLFMQQEQRLLGLVMSHILDQQVALIISRVLFQVSRGCGPMTSIEYKSQLKQKKSSSSAERIITSLQTINIIRNTEKNIINQNDQNSMDGPATLVANDTSSSNSTELLVVKSDNDSQESIKNRIDSNKKDISTTAPINIDKLINSETSSNASSSSSTSNNNDNTNKNLSTSITNPTAAVA